MEILVVEDDVPNAEIISRALKRWDHQVLWVATGKEAVEKAQSHFFDLVLLDIMLPDVMGYELIPKFKKYLSKINVVTMTGHSTLEMEKKVRAYGITYYMAKPVLFDELKSILNHLSRKKIH